MRDLLTTVEGLAKRFLKDPASTMAALSFLADQPFQPKRQGM